MDDLRKCLLLHRKMIVGAAVAEHIDRFVEGLQILHGTHAARWMALDHYWAQLIVGESVGTRWPMG